jgi:hypothetical protein
MGSYRDSGVLLCGGSGEDLAVSIERAFWRFLGANLLFLSLGTWAEIHTGRHYPNYFFFVALAFSFGVALIQ